MKINRYELTTRIGEEYVDIKIEGIASLEEAKEIQSSLSNNPHMNFYPESLTISLQLFIGKCPEDHQEARMLIPRSCLTCHEEFVELRTEPLKIIPGDLSKLE